MSVEEFLSLESHADLVVEELPLLSLPIMTVLSACYHLATVLFHGSPINEAVKPRPLAGETLACRLSYLTPLLLRCPGEPVGAGAYDAMSIMTEDDHRQLGVLVSYGHLCELAPEVRRGYYSVSIVEPERLYSIAHISEEFSRVESRDIILNDLAIPLAFNPPFIDQELFDAQVSFLPKVDTDLFATFVQKGTEWYLKSSFECPIVSDQALLEGIGISLSDFYGFRAGWLSIAEYCKRMAAAISRALTLANEAPKEKLLQELMDWEALYVREERLFDLIKQATGLTRDRYEHLMRIFCIDPKADRIAAGDGFYPPFLRLGDSLLFQPDVLKLMLSSRNIPYALNKIDRERFDTKLSPHLEPRLLQVALEILQQVPSIRIGTNLKWEDGEIDMLVFHLEENVALHIQAKAALPPQGSRMVHAIETRVLEGVKQLTAFRLLAQSQKDSIISRAFNVQAVEVRIVDALLVWSGFGTKKIWDQLDHIATLNIALLFMLVKRNRLLPLDQIAMQTAEIIDEIVKAATPHWGFDRITIGEYEVEVPRFDYDASSLFRYKDYLKQIQ